MKAGDRHPHFVRGTDAVVESSGMLTANPTAVEPLFVALKPLDPAVEPEPPEVAADPELPGELSAAEPVVGSSHEPVAAPESVAARTVGSRLRLI